MTCALRAAILQLASFLTKKRSPRSTPTEWKPTDLGRGDNNWSNSEGPEAGHACSYGPPSLARFGSVVIGSSGSAAVAIAVMSQENRGLGLWGWACAIPNAISGWRGACLKQEGLGGVSHPLGTSFHFAGKVRLLDFAQQKECVVETGVRRAC